MPGMSKKREAIGSKYKPLKGGGKPGKPGDKNKAVKKPGKGVGGPGAIKIPRPIKTKRGR